MKSIYSKVLNHSYRPDLKTKESKVFLHDWIESFIYDDLPQVNYEGWLPNVYGVDWMSFHLNHEVVLRNSGVFRE
jgi:hypothetical protein